MKRLSHLFIGILLLVSFAGFSKYVKQGHMRDVDFVTTVKLQNKIPARFDQLWDDGAILADPIVSSLVVLVITGWAFVRAKGGKKIWVGIIPLAFLALTLSEIYGKTSLPHAGPPFFLVKHPTTIFPKFHVLEPYSYPSGHAARITFVGSVLLGILWIQKKHFPKKYILSAIVLSYVAFIYVSRIYLGHHWASDIIGGILLGSAFGLLVLFSTQKTSDGS